MNKNPEGNDVVIESWSEVGRQMSLLRPLRELVCPVDGTVFLARDRRAIYCSPRCGMQDWRAVQKAKKLAEAARKGKK